MQQLHQGRTDLFGTPASLQMFEGVPLTIPKLKASVQGHGLGQGPIGPSARRWCRRRLRLEISRSFGRRCALGIRRNHGEDWTGEWDLDHPGAMRLTAHPDRPRLFERWRPRRHPLRWTHLFARLLSLAERARRPDIGGASVANRRLQQRLALAQRLMEALPASLMPGTAVADRFWVALRWGGLGLVVARLLR